MFKFILISRRIDKITNPFIIGIRDVVSDVDENICYLIDGPELANELFTDFDFRKNHIKGNFYWFGDQNEMDDIIRNQLSILITEPKVIMDVKDLYFTGDVFYIESADKLYILNKNIFYHADLRIISMLSRKKVDLLYIQEDNFVSSDLIKVLKKEIGLLDEIYDEKHYIEFLEVDDLIYSLLLLYEDLWKHRDEYRKEYKIDNRYNNPYLNILKVEEYLNGMRYYNIDTDKCEEYGLKYDRLPAKYSFNGFYSTTGRIFCSSEYNLWTPIQNIPKNKRDVLYADKSCFLIEFDYKSFEFDLLCQIVDESVRNDPHTFIYDKLIGLPHIDSRNIGKRINYSFIYGMNEKRLAESIATEFENLPSDFIEQFLIRLNAEPLIPKIKALESEIKTSIKNETITNYFGRNIHFKKEFAVLNNYIQSTAADFINNKFLLLCDMLDKNNKIILQNHDSILLQMDEQSIEHTSLFEDVKSLLESPISGLTGRVEYKYGKSWGEMK